MKVSFFLFVIVMCCVVFGARVSTKLWGRVTVLLWVYNISYCCMWNTHNAAMWMFYAMLCYGKLMVSV